MYAYAYLCKCTLYTVHECIHYVCSIGKSISLCECCPPKRIDNSSMHFFSVVLFFGWCCFIIYFGSILFHSLEASAFVYMHTQIDMMDVYVPALKFSIRFISREKKQCNRLVRKMLNIERKFQKCNVYEFENIILNLVVCVIISHLIRIIEHQQNHK